MPKTFDENYKELAMAIVKQAALDYKQGLLDNDKREIRDDEKFFTGNWFKQLAPDLNGPALMQRLKDTTLEFRDACEDIFAECDNSEDPILARANLSTQTKGSWDQESFLFKCPVCDGKVFVDYRRLGFYTAISQTEEDTINKTGEKWGYHAVCSGCNMFCNRQRESRMYETPTVHCHCNKQVKKMRLEKEARAKKTEVKLTTKKAEAVEIETVPTDEIFELVD